MSKVILMDGRNAIFRHYYVNRKLSTDEGFPTGAIYGCLNSMISIAKRLPDASFIWVWDGGGETWRHRFMNKHPQIGSRQEARLIPVPGADHEDFLATSIQGSLDFLGVSKPKPESFFSKWEKVIKQRPQGYKANRVYAESEEKDKQKYPTDDRARAVLQIPVLKLILEGMGIKNFEIRGLEGDDLIAILATCILEAPSKSEVIIHSGDRDFYQMLANHRVKILKNMQEGKLVWVQPDEIEAKYGVRPRHWTKYRAWTGDSGDNIPHLFKVGPKTALKMLAAGMDPSNPDWAHITNDAQEVFGKYFPGGIQNMWPAVHGNYKLCRLVTKIDDPVLSSGVRGQLAQLDMTPGRNEQQKTPEAYRKVSFLLMQYQMAEALGNLKTLWAIP